MAYDTLDLICQHHMLVLQVTGCSAIYGHLATHTRGHFSSVQCAAYQARHVSPYHRFIVVDASSPGSDAGVTEAALPAGSVPCQLSPLPEHALGPAWPAPPPLCLLHQLRTYTCTPMPNTQRGLVLHGLHVVSSANPSLQIVSRSSRMSCAPYLHPYIHMLKAYSALHCLHLPFQIC